MEAVDRYAFEYGYEDTRYVGALPDFVEFARLDERREHCPV